MWDRFKIILPVSKFSFSDGTGRRVCLSNLMETNKVIYAGLRQTVIQADSGQVNF